MLEKLQTHKHIKYFYLYAISFLIYGACISELGPFIPYLSVATGIVETQYSYLFSCRSFGMLAGALICKYLQKRKHYNHTIIIVGTLAIFLFSFFFTYTANSFWLGVWLFLIGAGYSILQIMLNVCILMINNPDQIEFWMLLTHGLFGVGGLMGPIIVYFFQTKAFLVLGIFIGAIAPFCYKIKSPQFLQGLAQNIHSPTLKSKKVSRSLQICLCLLLFMYIGNQCTYGGWISSYAVLTGVTNNQGATVFPSIFWIVLSACRFIMVLFPGSSSEKLKWLIVSCFWSGAVSLLIIYAGYTSLACYVSGVIFGISLSSIYPLIFAFPLEHGLTIEDGQTANIVMTGVVSEGILTMFVGALMNWIHVNMLFYSLSVVALIMWFLLKGSMHLIYSQKEQLKSLQLQIQLLDKSPDNRNVF